MKVVRLSALRTGLLYPPGNIPGTHFCQRLSRPQDHSAAGRIMSMKNTYDTIGNRSRNLPACSGVPQPTALPATCPLACNMKANILHIPFSLSANSVRMVTTATKYNNQFVSYIHHGPVAHRNKFPSCQCELLVSCGNDDDQTALK